MSVRSEIIPRRSCLIDSSAYFALAERRETQHAAARAIATRLQTEKWHVVTTNFVVAEAHALLLTRMGRSLAARFLFDIDQSRSTTVVRATVVDEAQARGIIARYDDKDFSLTDAISFAVMERLQIRSAFAFDRHFTQFGLTVVTPDQF